LIVKYRGTSIKKRKLEALIRRLPKNHPKIQTIIEDLNKHISGIKGEESLDYYLNFLDNKKFHVFQDLRLEGANGAFQLDFLLVALEFILVIEAKNYVGEIIIEEKYNQLIKKHNDKEEYYPDPIRQVLHQRFQLITWLKDNNFPVPPIEMLVVFTNTNSRVQTIASTPIYKNNIIRPTLLIEKINSLTQNHNRDMIGVSTFKKLSKKLLKSHTPLDENLITKYNIDINDIITGVQCPNCMNTPIQKIRANWVCSICNSISKDAHLLAIEDYALLIKDKFSISEIREFFNLESKSIATKLITKLNLKHEGKSKGRIYTFK
jgi:hypothetical protein